MALQMGEAIADSTLIDKIDKMLHNQALADRKLDDVATRVHNRLDEVAQRLVGNDEKFAKFEQQMAAM